jgi:glycosyltransferase involved in cell wall biosynthesis
MNELRALVVSKHWEHHTASGGYVQLEGYVGTEVVHRRRDGRSILWRIPRRLWRLCSYSRPYLIDYGYEDWLAEMYVLCRSRWKRLDVVHVLNGDEQLDLLLRQRRLLSCPLIATFHLPAHRVRERFEVTQKHLLTGIDLAVVVSRTQLPAFRGWLGEDRVVYIPHGINTDRFCPGERVTRQGCARVITVGQHMRDWEAIGEIINQCNAQNLEVRFDFVAWQIGLPRSAHYPNVHFHSGIPEEQLIQLYREADALLMPVLDATATNAALEALACGTPVISTRIGGMEDYVDDTCGWLFEPGEVTRIVELISDLCNEPEVGSSRRSGARNKALGFSWDAVAQRMRVVYDAVARHRNLEVVHAEWG